MARDQLETAMTRWIGLDPRAVGSAVFERALRSARERLGVGDDADVVHRIASDKSARDRLVEDIVVSESWFFRDLDSLAFIVERLVSTPGVRRSDADQSPGRPVRILSMPAAAGEEPRSIAMLLFDAGLDESCFHIDAFDISREAGRRATTGRYSRNAFRTTGTTLDERVSRWFRREGTTFLIDQRVARVAPVHWGNVLDPFFMPPRAPYDVICCRNLLIYLTSDARRHLIDRLHAWLAPEGLLVVGSAESTIVLDRFTPASSPSRFVLRRLDTDGSRVSRTTLHPAESNLKPRPHGRVESAVSLSSPSTPRSTHEPQKPEEALADDDGPTLRNARLLANQRRYAEAIGACNDHLDRTGPSAEAFFLLGTLHRISGSERDAIDCFRKAIYLDPEHVDAALALSLVRGQRP